MEALEETTHQEQPDEELATPVADEATRTSQEMFRYSAWVHVGPGAERCEDAETGDCGDPLHFHGWCRLPNQFQHRQIREKSLAAQARKTRQLRDPDSDSNAVLEDALDALARRGDDVKLEIVDELLSPEWFKRYYEAEQDVREFEDERGERPFEHLEQDRIRIAELRALDDEERPQEEYEELERHFDDFANRVDARVKEIEQPERDALMALDVNELVDQVREARIRREAHDEFMHTYSTWSWFLGTLVKPPYGERRFKTVEQLEAAAPEVIESIQEVFNDLERTHGRGVSGNS